MTCDLLDSRLMRRTCSMTCDRMAMRGIDHDDIDAGIDQRLGAGEALFADAGRGRDAQPALLVLGALGWCAPSPCP